MVWTCGSTVCDPALPQSDSVTLDELFEFHGPHFFLSKQGADNTFLPASQDCSQGERKAVLRVAVLEAKAGHAGGLCQSVFSRK